MKLPGLRWHSRRSQHRRPQPPCAAASLRLWKAAAIATVIQTFALATTASAQVVANSPRGIVIAHDGRLELHGGWSTTGVENATLVVAGDTRVAVVDALSGDVRVVDLANGYGTVMHANETPVAGVFLDDRLFLLERDARALVRIDVRVGRDGTRASLKLAADPAFLRVANRRLYVYARNEGIVQEIDPDRFTITRSVRVAPFASDFETDGRTGYLLFPRDAKLRTFSLTTMKTTGEVGVGAVPVDIAFASGSGALSARTLAVADPSAKKVWLVEGSQSFAQSIARGFLRGLLGLGLYANRTSQFPTGVDRVETRGGTWLAYDSSSGTLYRFTKSKSSVVAKDVAPKGFAITRDGVAVWRNGALQLIP